jgi:hypothetical protein
LELAQLSKPSNYAQKNGQIPPFSNLTLQKMRGGFHGKSVWCQQHKATSASGVLSRDSPLGVPIAQGIGGARSGRISSGTPAKPGFRHEVPEMRPNFKKLCNDKLLAALNILFALQYNQSIAGGKNHHEKPVSFAPGVA